MDTKETLTRQLLQKLAVFGEGRLREVIEFVDFLAIKEASAEDPVLQVAGCLSGAPLSASEIEAELYGNNPL